MEHSTVFNCPYCNGLIEVQPQDIHCGIFRHGDINPHASEIDCKQESQQHPNMGCFQPFTVLREEDGSYRIEKCGFI